MYSCRKTIPPVSVWAQSKQKTGMERNPNEFEPIDPKILNIFKALPTLKAWFVMSLSVEQTG